MDETTVAMSEQQLADEYHALNAALAGLVEARRLLRALGVTHGQGEVRDAYRAVCAEVFNCENFILGIRDRDGCATAYSRGLVGRSSCV